MWQGHYVEFFKSICYCKTLCYAVTLILLGNTRNWSLSGWSMGWRRKISVDKRGHPLGMMISIFFLLNLHLTLNLRTYCTVKKLCTCSTSHINKKVPDCDATEESGTKQPKETSKETQRTRIPASDAGLCKALISRSWSQSEISRQYSEFYWYRLEGKRCTC